MTCFFWVPMLWGLVSQAPPPAGDTPADLKARLEFMKRSMAAHEIRATDARGGRYRLQADPVLRFTNPLGGSKDGGLFLWLDDADRPVVASQILWNPQRIWVQELSSLSAGPLEAISADRRFWKPARAGAAFLPVPDAPRPAETAERRLRQMRQIAEGFSVEDFYKGTSWNQLRLLTRPLARYGKPGSDVQDGALFCFALATDPEALLMLESRPGQDGPRWQYAFAPMTVFAIKASRKGRAIWSKPAEANGSARDPSNTFFARRVPIVATE